MKRDVYLSRDPAIVRNGRFAGVAHLDALCGFLTGSKGDNADTVVAYTAEIVDGHARVRQPYGQRHLGQRIESDWPLCSTCGDPTFTEPDWTDALCSPGNRLHADRVFHDEMARPGISERRREMLREAISLKELSPLFFPTQGGATSVGSLLCERCPIIDDCDEYATVRRLDGIWAGRTLRHRPNRKRAPKTMQRRAS